MSRLIGQGTRSAALLCLLVLLDLRGGGQASKDREFRKLLQQGFALHQQANYAKAILLFERARQLDPNDYFANLLLGIDLLRTRRAVEAIGYLQTAARVNPKDDTAEEYLGEAEASLGHFSRSAAAYIEGLRRDERSEDSLLAWAGFALERFRQIGEQLRSSEAGIAALRRLQTEASKPVGSLRCSEPHSRPRGETCISSSTLDAGTRVSVISFVSATRSKRTAPRGI